MSVQRKLNVIRIIEAINVSAALLGALVVVEFSSSVSSSKRSSLRFSVEFTASERNFPDFSLVSCVTFLSKDKSSRSVNSTAVSLSSFTLPKIAFDDALQKTFKKNKQKFSLELICFVDDDFTSANAMIKTDENFIAT